MLIVEALRRILGLVPHPVEGGYLHRNLPERGASPRERPALPLRRRPRRRQRDLLYLLTPGTFSAMHCLASDEIFHFYLGDPVEMLHLHPDGAHRIVVLGPDLEAGQRPQVIVPRHIWQGARLIPGGQYALLGTTVAPGFDHTDYETAPRARPAPARPASPAQTARSGSAPQARGIQRAACRTARPASCH